MLGAGVSDRAVWAEDVAPEPKESAWRWRAMAGAEINADPHGVLDLGIQWHQGPHQASLQLLTDALELRYDYQGGRGRGWAALRGESGAAGLMISPWTYGAPDPARALSASYGGVEGGWMAYLPWGFYVGPQVLARYYVFGPSGENEGEVPEARPLVQAEAVLGFYRPIVQVWLRGGVSLGGEKLSDHLALHASFELPAKVVRPFFELNAAVAENQDFVTLTRVGGLTPYVVPLAGAAWGEWWAEDFLAIRAGARWSHRSTQIDLFVDGVEIFDPVQVQTTALGVGVSAFQGIGHYWWVAVDVGHAPVIERQPGISATGVWLRAGRRWGPRKARD